MSHVSESSPPNDELTLVTPTRFDTFPYEKPYDIQLQLMQHLYEAIESRSLAMYDIYQGFEWRQNVLMWSLTRIESPTGTGKTLSLLTAALGWLHDDRERARKGQIAKLVRSLKEKSGATGTPIFLAYIPFPAIVTFHFIVIKTAEPEWVIEQVSLLALTPTIPV